MVVFSSSWLDTRRSCRMGLRASFYQVFLRLTAGGWFDRKMIRPVGSLPVIYLGTGCDTAGMLGGFSTDMVELGRRFICLHIDPTCQQKNMVDVPPSILEESSRLLSRVSSGLCLHVSRGGGDVVTKVVGDRGWLVCLFKQT